MAGLIDPIAPQEAPKFDTGTTLQQTTTDYAAKAPAAPADATAATYDVKQPTDTVAGQLDTLLAKGSPLLQRAESQGLQAANARGLLNSSMGVEAGKAALLDKALPIAQQDAQTYATAGMKNTDNQQQTNLANQSAANQRYLSDTGIQANFALTNQAAENDLTKLQAGAEYKQAEIAATGANERANTQLTNDAAMQRLIVDNQEQAARLGMDLNAELQRLQYSNDQEMQRLRANLDQRAAEAFAQSYTPLNQQYMAEWTKIATSPDYADPISKQADLDALSYSFKNNTTTLAQLYGYNIDLGTMTNPGGAETTALYTGQINNLETQNTLLNSQVTTLSATNADLQKQLDAANAKLSTLTYVG